MADEARDPANPLRDLAAALGFLTLLPVGRTWPKGAIPRAVGFYPWVGWLLGGAAGGVLWAAMRLSGHAPVGGGLLLGALTIGGWALLTRLLHWDGLADTFDGLWGGATPERRLEIMRDSRIGSFGAAAIVMVAIVQTAAVADIVHAGVVWPVVVAPVFGRAAVSMAAWTMPSPRDDGLGLTAIGRPGAYDLVAWSLATAGIALLAGWAPVTPLTVVCTVGLMGVLLIPRALARPVGGMTGDLFGATVLLVETLVLVTGAVVS
jgi:adenosylcobinamide-GDP ribazoletransferase